VSQSTSTESTLKSRLAAEIKRYAMISLYLFVCFGVLLIYEASQSATKEASLLTVGVALVKALVLGKFILIGEVVEPGSRIDAPTLLHRIAWRTVGMLVVLIVFKLLEELVVGMVHSQGIGELVAELGEQSWLSLLGPVLLMLLILVPMVTAIELDRALGSAGLMGLLLDPEK
jgi:uncharacterized membrane protein YjfL (UPF0719 family)